MAESTLDTLGIDYDVVKWMGKVEPLPRLHDSYEDRDWDPVKLPGGGFTGTRPKVSNTPEWRLRGKRIVSLEAERLRSFAAVVETPVLPDRVLFCACGPHTLDNERLVLRLDAYEEGHGKQRRYVFVCGGHAKTVMGPLYLKTRLRTATNARCCLMGEINGATTNVVTVGGKMYPWGHQPVNAFADVAAPVLAAICAFAKVAPQELISVEDGVDPQQVDEFFQDLEERVAEIDLNTYDAPPADYAQPQTSTRIDEVSARTSRRRKKKEEEKEANEAAAEEAAKEEKRAARANFFKPRKSKKTKPASADEIIEID